MRGVACSILAAGAVLLLPGFTTPWAANTTSERITYATSQGPFCGRCESLKVVAAVDGRVSVERGHWAGRYKVWRVSRQMFRVLPEQVALFRERLAPYRPAGSVRMNELAQCNTLTDDLPEVSVTWSGPDRDDHLTFAFGCDFDTRVSMREALRDAPAALGLQSPLMPPKI